MVNDAQVWGVDKDIVSEYQKYNSKNSFTTGFVNPSFFKELGDLSGKNVLDLACGSGNRTRELKRMKGNIIVGVDINAHMIAEAKKINEDDGLGIVYFVDDALTFGYRINFEFDMVISTFLLVCASSVDDLRQFCTTAYNHLKPGARFVSLTSVLHDDTIKLGGKYDPVTLRTIKLETGEWKDGCQVQTTLFSDPDHACTTFYDYYWKFETISMALSESGFTDIVKTFVHPTNRSVVIISAVKPR